MDDPTPPDLVIEWLIGYPPATRRSYRSDIIQYIAWLDANDHGGLLEVTRGTIQRFLGYLSDNDYQPATIQRKTSAVASFYNYAVEEKILEHNPAEHVRRAKGGSVPKPALDADQIRSLIAAAREHSPSAHALVCLMAGVGLRVAEACSASIEDLNGDLLTVTVKGAAQQVKPLEEPTLGAVTEAIGPRSKGPILTNRDGRPLSRKRAWALIITLAARCGLDQCTPHTLRHTAATLALEGGASVQDVQQLLGHASLETTLRYIQHRDIAGGTREAARHLAAVLTGSSGAK